MLLDQVVVFLYGQVMVKAVDKKRVRRVGREFQGGSGRQLALSTSMHRPKCVRSGLLVGGEVAEVEDSVDPPLV